jgi:hypothetical protein
VTSIGSSSISSWASKSDANSGPRRRVTRGPDVLQLLAAIAGGSARAAPLRGECAPARTRYAQHLRTLHEDDGAADDHAR